MKAPLIEARDLTIGFRNAAGTFVDVVRDVSLELGPGETLGIVGETGCGKSTLASALLGHLRAGSVFRAGSVRFDDAELTGASRGQLQRLRRTRVAFVPQNAGQALTPTMRIGAQLRERVLGIGGDADADRAREESIRVLRAVRLPDPEALLERYPHQLSGGQQQRVAIATAVLGNPELVVLDEPTTGLDVTTQAHVLDIVEEMRERTGAALVYVSHDLGVIARVAEQLIVMYAGQVVEHGRTETLFARPRHPYTASLLAAVPRLAGTSLPTSLPGRAPAPGRWPEGCSLHPRCHLATDECRAVEPAVRPVDGEAGHVTRCHHWSQVTPPPTGSNGALRRGTADSGTAPLLEVTNLAVSYGRTGRRRFRRPSGTASMPVDTVADVNLTVGRGEVLALVGESGSGKSTIARTIAGLHPRREGEIVFEGLQLPESVGKRAAELRRRVQLIFQNPDSALNPRTTVEQIIGRPLRVFGNLSDAARRERTLQLLEEVGLGEQHMARYPSQLSGGERQRVSIARAFAADPDLVLCDEIVSALDVSVQASVLRLLERLRAERNVAYVFISHDLAVVKTISDRVAVLYLGRLAEVGTVGEVFAPPFHPYTESLLAAVLEPVPGTRPRTLTRTSEVEPAPPARGCPFQHRCPRHLGSICDDELPPWRQTASGHAIRCHIPLPELERDPLRDQDDRAPTASAPAASGPEHRP